MEYVFYMVSAIIVITAKCGTVQAMATTEGTASEIANISRTNTSSLSTPDPSSITKHPKIGASKIQAGITGGGQKSTVNEKMASPEQTAKSPPHITGITEPDTGGIHLISQGNELKVTCRADGYPAPSYEWYRNEEKITSQAYQVYEDGTLYAKVFTRNMDGYFQCKAKNTYGTSLSVKRPIQEKRSLRTSDGNQPEGTYDKYEGESFTLPKGKVPETNVPLTEQWYYVDYTESKPSDDMLVDSPRVAADSNGDLHFAYLIKSDTKTYRLALSAPNHKDLFSKGELTVMSAKKPGNREPVKQYVSTDVKAVLGEQVTLDCFFGGKPIPEIKWLNTSNHEIKEGDSKYIIKKDVGGKQLVINRVRQEDEGKFHCEAKNSEGLKSAAISVNVTSPPRRITDRGLTTLTVPDQQDYNLYCESSKAQGETTDTPIWYRNGDTLTKDSVPYPSRYTFNSDMTMLTIKNLSKTDDTACFQCNVTNSEGYLFMDGYLNVIDSIVITKQPDKVTEVDPNNTMVDLTVLARGDPCCEINYQWYLNGTELHQYKRSETPFSFNPQTEEFFLNASSVLEVEELFSKMGTYKCRVSNKHQHIDIQFSLQLAKQISSSTPSPRTIKKAESVNLLWLVPVILVLAAIAAIAGFVYYQKKTPGDTYQLGKEEVEHNLDPVQDLLNQSFHEI